MIEEYIRQREVEAGAALEDGYRSFLVIMFGHAVGETFVELALGTISLSPERFAEYLINTLDAMAGRVASEGSGHAG